MNSTKSELVFHAGPDPQVALLAFFQNGVNGVIDEVEKDLLQLVRIRGNLREVGCKIQMHADLAHAQVIVAKGQSIFESGIEAHGNAFGLMLPRKAQKVLHDAVSALGLFVEFLGIAESQRPDLPAGGQQLAVAEDRGKRIIQLVGNAGNELPDGGKFFAVQSCSWVRRRFS